jgi:hypothetical protein
MVQTISSRVDYEKDSQILSTRILYQKVSTKVEYESIHYSYYRDSAYESIDSCKIELSKVPSEKDDSFKTEFFAGNEEMCVELPQEFASEDVKDKVEEKKPDEVVSQESSPEMKSRKKSQRQRDNSLPLFFGICVAFLLLFYILKVKFIS